MWGVILRLGVTALASAGVGFAVGVSLPEVRRRLKEQEDEEKALLEKEREREHEQERQELEQVSKMSPEAQVHYFERRRDHDEKKAEEERAARREKAAREGLGGVLMLVGMRFRSLAFLILLGREIAASVVSVAGWAADVFRRAPAASPLGVRAA